jgi:hypothetical protein
VPHASGAPPGRAALARKRAQADLVRAIATDPGLAEAHFNLGVFSLRSVDLARKLGNAAAADHFGAAARDSLERARLVAPPNWLHSRACEAKLRLARPRTKGP